MHSKERLQGTESADLDCAMLAMNLYESIQVEEVDRAYMIYQASSTQLLLIPMHQTLNSRQLILQLTGYLVIMPLANNTHQTPRS
jgi:hypothetical protein